MPNFDRIRATLRTTLILWCLGLSFAAHAYDLMLSASENRSSPSLLEGSTVQDNVYIFVAPEAGISRVRFFIDDAGTAGAPAATEMNAPYDLGGTRQADGTAKPFATPVLADGDHTVSAVIERTDGAQETISATMTVANAGPPLSLLLSATPERANPSVLQGSLVNGSIFVFIPPASGISSVSFFVDDPQAAGTPVRTENVSPFDLAGSLPDGTARGYATSQLENGAHTLTALVRFNNGNNQTMLQAQFVVDNPEGGKCIPVRCSEVLVQPPYQLHFTENHGGAPDRHGVGTGFTYVDPPTRGSGYLPQHMMIDTTAGELRLTTTPGIAFTSANAQDNALGIGIDAPSQISVLTATIINPPQGTGGYEQAGLWFGTDEDNYDKLVVLSTPNGTKIQHLHEVDGTSQGAKSTAVMDMANTTLTLILKADPAARTVSTEYRLGNGPTRTVASFVAPPEFFSFDAAGIDPEIGTRSFGGIFATHRRGTAPLTYTFGSFSLTADTAPVGGGGGVGAIDFTRTPHPLSRPTSMAWGPDGRLYVSELLGNIHALRFDESRQVIQDQLIDALTRNLGNRLTLGLTVDPASTEDDVVLWVAHSSASLSNGVPNSGVVSRISGPGFSTIEHVITGLPRAIANHGTNSLHFGADGRLYIAQGGNTGAGAPNDQPTEFGNMEEQPLSAAILVADVKAPGFDGSCHNVQDLFGPPPCDVAPYATGLRNAYDFLFHSNGYMYAPDNGLGVAGTIPPSAEPPCLGHGDPRSWEEGGDDPGEQPDILVRVMEGMYYGHPNPHRDECVFKDGSYQGVAPPPNYMPPMLVLGEHTSSNAIIEYPSNVGCNDLAGELLITNFSLGDDIVRVRLSPDGLSVVSSGRLVGGFQNPLPLALDPAGNIYVGEYGANQVTALSPISLGCWMARASVPAAVLDAGGAALGGKFYMVGGKTSEGHVSTLYVYDPTSDSWSRAPDLPGPAVENPAVEATDGKLYVFGGSTAPFSGAVGNAAVFDPSTGSWSQLAPMPTPRGGAAARALNGKIYVLGGLNGSGTSLREVEIYDPASNTWSTGTPMNARRDNAGAALLDGRLYVFGGRLRESNGTEVDPTLSTVEMFDPATGNWTARAPMPTGRRTMAVGTVEGRAQLMGGERTPNGGTFVQNEEYDPLSDSWRTLAPMTSGRHGAAFATIGNRVYVSGGGTQAGTSFTSVTEAFHF